MKFKGKYRFCGAILIIGEIIIMSILYFILIGKISEKIFKILIAFIPIIFITGTTIWLFFIKKISENYKKENRDEENRIRMYRILQKKSDDCKITYIIFYLFFQDLVKRTFTSKGSEKILNFLNYKSDDCPPNRNVAYNYTNISQYQNLISFLDNNRWKRNKTTKRIAKIYNLPNDKPLDYYHGYLKLDFALNNDNFFKKDFQLFKFMDLNLSKIKKKTNPVFHIREFEDVYERYKPKLNQINDFCQIVYKIGLAFIDYDGEIVSISEATTKKEFAEFICLTIKRMKEILGIGRNTNIADTINTKQCESYIKTANNYLNSITDYLSKNYPGFEITSLNRFFQFQTLEREPSSIGMKKDIKPFVTKIK